MSRIMNQIPSGCCSRSMGFVCCRRMRQPEEIPPPPMTEEEMERFECLENMLPCHIYRKENDDAETPYRLYDGFDDKAQSKPLSIRLHQEECSICLMDYDDGEKLTSSHNPKCPHAFHRDCMQRWLVSNSECPCCRKGFLEFGDDHSDEGGFANMIPLGSRISLLSASVQQHMGRIREDIGNQLQPIILRLEQQQTAEIMDSSINHRRTNHRDDGGTTNTTNHATRYHVNDESHPYPALPYIQHRMERIREGLIDQLENMRIRIEQNRISRRGDDRSADDASLGETSDADDSMRRSDNDNRQTNAAVMVNLNLEGSDIVSATNRVLAMGSARWKDVTRMVGQSFRGELASLQSSRTTSESNSSPEA